MFFQHNKDSSSLPALHRVFDGARRAEIGHVCIDPQRRFVTTKTGLDAVGCIGGKLVPVFREIGVSNYWVYMSYKDLRRGFLPQSKGSPAGESHGGFCDGIVPKRKVERLFPKAEYSAFTNDDFGNTLQEEDKKILLVTGFEFLFCVFETAVVAPQKGHKTILLKDGTDFNTHATDRIASLEAAGVILADSREVLPILRELEP